MKSYIAASAALALALCLSGVAQAADGTLGATSTGTFAANLTVSPIADQVQITRLQDFAFPEVRTESGSPFPVVGAIEKPFCLIRTIAGNVTVSISGPASPSGFFDLPVVGGASEEGVSADVHISIQPIGSNTTYDIAPNQPQVMPASAAGCDANSGSAASLGHILKLRPHLSGTGIVTGPVSFAGNYSILVSPTSN